MPRIVVDGAEWAASPDATTWGAVLEALDARFEGDGRIVTDVRFDGLDEPAFRDGPTLARPIGELAVIEVASGTRTQLMTRCLTEAAAAIPDLRAAAMRTGDAYRGFELEAANRGLVELAEGIGTLLSIVGAAGLALQVDLRSITSSAVSVSGFVDEMTGHLDAMLLAQSSGDWITVADILQYDLEPALGRIGPYLDALLTSAAVD